ncbi:FtsP/CotA-like multicopper oxidase with cupredoxin domain [Nocardioides sp. BE266]|uniref:multicopper oxidase domain-containing protein n=1 Tax=Nocardioides sp. BE266 TaxID=2817725 RepID=UPI002859841C|nr:multicopper oxidase domain-containing protein [Nocardioides sp. BE266]MDR7253521.1 FtsP/CotA-like multicopper oxidase with cupredoxin domain [Nocardioides sp. BE266]
MSTHLTRSSRLRLVAASLPVAALATLGSAAIEQTGASAAPSSMPPVGIVCTTPEAGPGGQKIFNITTRTGYISLPDGNTAFMWGYSSGFDAFQHPGPVLCVNEGDSVTVILHNTLPDPSSIAFPGQTDVLADGVPAQLQRDVDGLVTSLTDPAPADGGTITYSFTADHPGTFLYESGTNPEKQVRMGLFGALIVRPAMGADHAYNRADTQFNADEEFMVLLSEIDPYQHQRVEQGRAFNMNNYHPRYWLINGRGFPDSIADNGASWLPTQPYGALAQIYGYDATDHPLPGMARYLNVGTEDYPFHPHGNNGLVVGRDGQPLENAGGNDLSMEKFAINIGPGQTWDVIFRWYDAEDYSAANPVPVTVPDLSNSSIGTFYSGTPYLGSKKALPPGVQTLNQCGEFYIISHNHALFQITSWGANMTGPITYMRIDPPGSNHCRS